MKLKNIHDDSGDDHVITFIELLSHTAAVSSALHASSHLMFTVIYEAGTVIAISQMKH